MTARSLSALVSRAAVAAGLPENCVPHGLRKAALTRLADHSATTKEIQAVIAHSVRSNAIPRNLISGVSLGLPSRDYRENKTAWKVSNCPRVRHFGTHNPLKSQWIALACSYVSDKDRSRRQGRQDRGQGS